MCAVPWNPNWRRKPRERRLSKTVLNTFPKMKIKSSKQTMNFVLTETELSNFRCAANCTLGEDAMEPAELFPLQNMKKGKWPTPCGHYLCRACLNSMGLGAHCKRMARCPLDNTVFVISCPLCRCRVTPTSPHPLITALLGQERKVEMPCGTAILAKCKETHQAECLKCLTSHCKSLESKVKSLEEAEDPSDDERYPPILSSDSIDRREDYVAPILTQVEHPMQRWFQNRRLSPNALRGLQNIGQ